MKNKYEFMTSSNRYFTYLLLSLASLIVTFFSQIGYSQEIISSPISRYGYGIIPQGGATASKGMGGVGIGLRSPSDINLHNPAGFSASDSLSFLLDLSVSANLGFYNDAASNRKNTFLGNLDYIAVQFPLYKNVLILSTGITPFSRVGYNVSNRVDIHDNTTGNFLTQTFQGKGSTQNLYLGLGLRVFKRLSIGGNIKYLFGSLEHNVYNIPNSQLLSRVSTNNTLKIRGVSFDFGAQYTIDILNHKLTLGGVFTPASTFSPKASYLNNQNQGSSTQPDITFKEESLNTKIPTTFGIGGAFEYDSKLLIASDIKIAKWRSVPNIFTTDGVVLKDMYTVGLGAQYKPNSTSRDFFNRVAYRGGVNYSKGYMEIGNLGHSDAITGSLGLGLPINVNDEKTSFLNISLEYTRALPSTKQLLQENYLKISVGINFNETWFRKLKIY